MKATRWIGGMSLVLALGSGVFAPTAQAFVGIGGDPISGIDGRDVGETVDAEQLAVWRLQKIGACVRYDDRKFGQPIVAVDLSGCRVSDETLKELLPLCHLRRLNLSGTRVTDEGVKTLVKIRTLEALDLHKTCVKNLKSIVSLKQSLPKLEIECDYFPPPAVVP